MFFSEIYGAYYNVVAKIIAQAIEEPIDVNSIRKIAEKTAFEESVMNIENSLSKEKWQLIKKDGNTPLKHSPTMLLTTLQKRWLKAISLDPRIKLFGEDFSDLDHIEPLFTKDDYFVFDKYADGDPYEDSQYIKNFRLILDAIHKKYPLKIEGENRAGGVYSRIIMPKYLEYSEKDDKFRLISLGGKEKSTYNLGRIYACEKYVGDYKTHKHMKISRKPQVVCFELKDERNALDRVMMHFAHFQKEAEQTSENTYLVRVTYDEEDETELLIRILSFGPMIKVTDPPYFQNLIKERLLKQKSCGY